MTSIPEALPYGLKVLAEGINPILDIVAVHGLNGHREKSWTANGVNWLRDFLPSDIPTARILTWGYDVNTHSTSQISAQYLYDHAVTLVSDLSLQRNLEKTQTRPLIFIAHGLGGIVVKSALIHSDAARQGALEGHRSIKLSTYGIFFMGTPHQGSSGVHLGELMLNMASIFVKPDNKIFRHLEQDSEWLQQQLGQYGPINKDIVTKFGYETYPTRIALGRTIMVVPHASAIIPGVADAESVAIPANHLNMVKFTSREDGGYDKVSGHLRLLAQDAPGVVDARWAEQGIMREALSKIDEDFSVPFSLSGVPEIDNFISRDKELLEINEEFQGNGSHRKTVLLQGLGGIGKTQLAVTFIKQHRNIFSAVFWLNGQNEDALRQGFANMTKRLYKIYPSSTLLKTAAESKDSDQMVEAMKQWLSAKDNFQWMLVFDNIDNPKLPGINDPQAYDIRSYFPEVHQGFILITTRSSRLKVVGKVILVKKLQDIGESIAILANTSKRQISDQDPHAVKLAKSLDGLPLALATAGAYLHQMSTSLADYLLDYSTSWLKLQETSPELSSYEDRALYSTWNISYKHIYNQNESAGKLLQLWGYFDNQDLWYGLLAAGSDCSPDWFSNLISDELSFSKAIRLLCDHALIESHGFSSGYGMHSCVHAWIKYALNSERNISMTHLALRCVGFAVPDEDVFEYWALQQRLLPHANRYLELSWTDSILNSKDIFYTLHAIRKLGKLYSDQTKIKDAEEMFVRALVGYEKTCGPEHKLTLNTVNNLGVLYWRQGKLKDAEVMYLRALTGFKKIFSPEHTETLDVVNNMGVLYSSQGKIKDAEEMYLRALTGYEKTLGPEYKPTLDTVYNLGRLYSDQEDKLNDAEEMYLRALTGYEKTLGPEHTPTLKIVNNLGALYSNQEGKMNDAEEMYLRALTGYEKTLGPEHTSTLKTVYNLGHLYSNQEGRMNDAEEMYLRALTGFEKTLGPEHTSTLDTVYNLGRLYWLQEGKMNDAEKMYLWALTGYEKAWGAEHKRALDTRFNMALLYKGKDQVKDAIEQLELVVQGYSNSLGPDHWETVEASELLNSLKSN